MPPYTSEVRKAQYLTYREMGLNNTDATTRAKIGRQTRYDIWAQAGQLEIDHAAQNLPAPTIKELVAIKPKTGRSKALIPDNCNQIFVACTANKKAYLTEATILCCIRRRF
jgi:hypothetical protein